MNTKKKSSPESIVREIKRRTRRKYSAEEKIPIEKFLKSGEQGYMNCTAEKIQKAPYPHCIKF